MKKSFFGCFSLLPVALFAIPALTGCNASSDGGERLILRVLNSADYIYEEDDVSAYDEECDYNQYLGEIDENSNVVTPNADMMDQFVDYMKEVYDIDVDYVYDTFDTNETMFNQLKLGKSSYDIITPSDYMVQKLISNDLILDISSYLTDCGTEDPVCDPNVPSNNTTDLNQNVSSYLQDVFANIYPKDLVTNEPMLDKPLSNYTVAYMWGTVGMMYNPQYYVDKGIAETVDDVIDAFTTWDVLYDETYKNTFSIKDSVRDVYAMSVIHAFKEEISALKEKLDNSEITEAEFNKQLNAIFNRCDNDTLNIIKQDMLALKANSFGFEVDSGKTDMATSKIGANLAWSGDATWSITEAEDSYEKELYFSIPEEGSNIWFDAFCVPKTSKNPWLAVKFMEFMSKPKSAIQNMWYVGYTSAVNGDEVLDYVYENYDVRGYVDADPADLDDEVNAILDQVTAGTYDTYDISYFFDDDPNAVLVPYEEAVGRQLTAQYPSKEMLPHLCVMDDFGTQNEAVLDMWEQVRTNSLPIWAIVILVVEFLAALSVFVYFMFQKHTKKLLKKARRQERLAN